MTPTTEQIVAEAKRRADDRKWAGAPIEYFIIEVTREGWTPPEPVDPDVLAFREWMKTSPLTPRPSGDPNRYDDVLCDAYLAGARMAREREQERAKVLVEYVEAHVRGLNVIFTHSEVLAKYRGEA